MRLVADTNIVVSGLLWLGKPGRLLEAAAAGALTLYTSIALVDELDGTLRAGKLAPRVQGSGLTVDELLRRYLDVAIIVDTLPIAPVVVADPDDDHVLACAVAARVDLIVSGDSDLLDLSSFQGIPIITAADALERIGQH